jgi:hypothetical protein
MSTSNVNLGDLLSDGGDHGAAVQIYEDASGDEHAMPKMNGDADAGVSMLTEVTNSFSSDLSNLQSDAENDPDEENDPIVHSFGPFGANLSNRLASFSTLSPIQPRIARFSSDEPGCTAACPTVEPAKPSDRVSTHGSPRKPADDDGGLSKATLSLIDTATISNHVANQLAFSRLSSNPLSAIMQKLPAEEKKDLTKARLRAIIESTPCVGIIPRQGKDAGGQPLESEYYYIPEMDTDDHRRLAVTENLRKPSLRNCRKQHKVCLC